jgi:hypothetical protein
MLTERSILANASCVPDAADRSASSKRRQDSGNPGGSPSTLVAISSIAFSPTGAMK